MAPLRVNGKAYTLKAGPEDTLLWVLREELRLKGTKFGCGLGICGACTVHVDGRPERSCQLTLSEVEGKAVTTIEGIPERHPLKLAWIEEQVPQCGYCQPGQIMQAASLLDSKPNPSDAEIIGAMDGNLCRCGTYNRIVRAIRRAAGKRS
jgi:isoquinoline 1-oxidoreductase alpha subunit